MARDRLIEFLGPLLRASPRAKPPAGTHTTDAPPEDDCGDLDR